MVDLKIKQEGKFKYLETGGDGEVLMLLHGLFGALSNFRGIVEHFSDHMNVVVPILPIYEVPVHKVSIDGLVEYVNKFVKMKGYDRVHTLGNSLGGHISLVYALTHPTKISSITLTGSSGLFESSLGSTFPRRGDYNYVKTKTEAVFYDPEVATKELVDEVYDIVNDRSRAIRLVLMAKSALRQNLADHLHKITAPTLLVWGNEDTVTPPFVAEKFNELIANTELTFVDKCGHAPMMEHPIEFNKILERFLQSVIDQVTTDKS